MPVGDDGVLVLTWNDAALVKAPAAGQPGLGCCGAAPASRAYVAPPVYRDGHLYGHGGDFLRCIRVSDGTIVWEERTYPGSVALVDGHLVALSITAGLLRVVEATPAGLSRARPAAGARAGRARRDASQRRGPSHLRPQRRGGRGVDVER